MENESFSICEMCRERIEPPDPDVVFAVEMKGIEAMGSTEYVAGLGAYFHQWHFPGGTRWRLKEKPRT